MASMLLSCVVELCATAAVSGVIVCSGDLCVFSVVQLKFIFLEMAAASWESQLLFASSRNVGRPLLQRVDRRIGQSLSINSLYVLRCLTVWSNKQSTSEWIRLHYRTLVAVFRFCVTWIRSPTDDSAIGMLTLLRFASNRWGCCTLCVRPYMGDISVVAIVTNVVTWITESAWKIRELHMYTSPHTDNVSVTVNGWRDIFSTSTVYLYITNRTTLLNSSIFGQTMFIGLFLIMIFVLFFQIRMNYAKKRQFQRSDYFFN